MNRRQSIGLFGGIIVSGGLVPAPAAACRLFPPDSTDRYAVFQQGKRVGSHALTFSRDGGRLVVETDTRFGYARAAGDQTGFTQRAREIWAGGWLNAFESNTHDGDRRIHVEAETLKQAILTVRSNAYDIPLRISGYVVTSNLWHRDTRLVNRLIDLVDGRLKLVKVHYAGKDMLSVAGEAAVASHYRIRGELNRDVWYGEDCRLVREVRPMADTAPVTLQLL